MLLKTFKNFADPKLFSVNGHSMKRIFSLSHWSEFQYWCISRVDCSSGKALKICLRKKNPDDKCIHWPLFLKTIEDVCFHYLSDRQLIWERCLRWMWTENWKNKTEKQRNLTIDTEICPTQETCGPEGHLFVHILVLLLVYWPDKYTWYNW